MSSSKDSARPAPCDNSAFRLCRIDCRLDGLTGWIGWLMHVVEAMVMATHRFVIYIAYGA